MNTNYGSVIFVSIFCVWPLIVHFAIVYTPRLIGYLLKRMPENPTDE